jgi:chromate reductase, NAD(P)H dehydrogenase (quinone)
MTKLKLGVIVGSNRRESINRKLAQALVLLGDKSFEARLIQIDDLPMYNQDHEQPVPAPVARFKGEVETSDALFFVTPEHSRSIPAVLKNAIDWGTRPWGKTSWPGKPAAIIGTSAGVVSTAVVQQHLRAVLAYIAYKPELIDAQNKVSDESVRKFLGEFMDKFAAFAARFAPTAASRAAA